LVPVCNDVFGRRPDRMARHNPTNSHTVGIKPAAHGLK
jgi:hypothetical protein